jgi:hypothetical protein
MTATDFVRSFPWNVLNILVMNFGELASWIWMLHVLEGFGCCVRVCVAKAVWQKLCDADRVVFGDLFFSSFDLI